MKLILASLAILFIHIPNAEALCLKSALLEEGSELMYQSLF